VPVPTGITLPRDTHEQLQPVLWMQTSAEYRALSESTYRAAGAALVQALGDPAWTAATEQTGDFARLPAAVILDLDETVLDNSRFQAEIALRRTVYSRDLWREWVRRRQAGLVPGAGEFLAAARGRKVDVFFVTNRTAEEEGDTLANLQALEVQATADEILSVGENDWPSEKTSRRQAIARDHRILLLVGDDLGDFLPAKLAPEKRVEAAEKYGSWWGARWFLLANPTYGSWDRALYDHDTTMPDRDVLLRKFARLKGFDD
jgi:acid phosphatase